MIRRHEWARALIALALTLALGLALALVVGALAATSFAAPAAKDTADSPVDFTWSGALTAGQTVTIHGVNGGIRAERTDGREAVVTARKRAHHSDPTKVRIVAEASGDGVTICVLYPDHKGNVAGDCEHSQTQDLHDNDVKVDFRVQLPKGVRLEAHTVNGSIEGVGLASEVTASTVNGSVRLSTSQAAEASTVNGSIETSVGEIGSTERLRFSTVNGSIVLRVPDGSGAEVHASTVNGRISTDFPILVSRGSFGPQSLHGTIGAGGREVTLSTVNGSIRLERID